MSAPDESQAAREELPRGTLAAAAGERPPTLAEAIGGPLGAAETALPGVAYVVAYTATGQDTETSAFVAVGVALVLAAARLVRRESPRFAISGLIGVGFAAFIAARSGKAENFFLPGLLFNGAYAAAFLGSLAARRPLVGLIVGQLQGEGSSWRDDPVRLRAYTQATWLWAGLFLLRLVVQLPLYLAGAVVALGVARTAMGVPLFAIGLFLTYRLLRSSSSSAALRPTP
jgi:hypothetical protein